MRRAKSRSTATAQRSGEGIAVSFLDDANPHAGWKTTFSGAKSWVRFNEVDFGRGGQKSIEVRAKATATAHSRSAWTSKTVRCSAVSKVGEGTDWKIASAAAKKIPAGVHDLIVTQVGAESVEVDWVSFR